MDKGIIVKHHSVPAAWRLEARASASGALFEADQRNRVQSSHGNAEDTANATEEGHVITCVIQYTLNPHKLEAFEDYASRWPPIIERCGGALTGYYLPEYGADNYALALIDFDSLAAYEKYRRQLAADPEAKQNFVDAKTSACILAETRSFLRHA